MGDLIAGALSDDKGNPFLKSASSLLYHNLCICAWNITSINHQRESLQDQNFSDNSADLLSEEGLRYDASLMGDDVPYIVKTDKGELVELPSYWGMDDWPQFVQYMDLDYMMPIKAASRGMEVCRDELDAMYEYGGLWVSVWHSFATGRLARWRKVVELIEYMKGKGDVWFAKMEDIARHVRQCIDDGSYSPRVVNLPYDTDKVSVIPYEKE